MRIALVSDTHLPRFGRALPAALETGIRDARCDLILHAGDWTDPIALELLERLAPVDGVAGNNDGPELQARFGPRRIVEAEGVRIGLVHGHLGRGVSTLERARQAFAGEPDVGVIVFGHSHVPLVRQVDDGPLLVNPGSPTDRRRQPDYSWALLTVEAGAVASIELRRYADRTPAAGRA